MFPLSSSTGITSTNKVTLTNKTLTSPIFQGTVDGWVSANETWTFSSADGATGIITVPSGAASKYNVRDRIKLTQTTVKYGIVTVVADTALTVYFGTDYTLANAAISANFYSHSSSPVGFPLDPTKWTVEVGSTTDRSQASPTANTWYNAENIIIPIGVWDVSYSANIFARDSATTESVGALTLSTANNSESDIDFTAAAYAQWEGSGTGTASAILYRMKVISLAAKTTYYLNMMSKNTIDNIYVLANSLPTKTIIRARCAYL